MLSEDAGPRYYAGEKSYYFKYLKTSMYASISSLCTYKISLITDE